MNRGEGILRELMAILDATAQEIVTLARLASRTASASVSDTRAAALGVFCRGGITGDGLGVDLVGMCPQTKPVSSVYGGGCVRQVVSRSLLCTCQ